MTERINWPLAQAQKDADVSISWTPAHTGAATLAAKVYAHSDKFAALGSADDCFATDPLPAPDSPRPLRLSSTAFIRTPRWDPRLTAFDCIQPPRWRTFLFSFARWFRSAFVFVPVSPPGFGDIIVDD